MKTITKTDWQTFRFQQADELPSGKYAMWHATSEEPRFTDSPTANHIQRTYDAFNGFESYAFGFILKMLGLEHELNRYTLPEDTFSMPLVGTDDQIFVFSVSQEKGFRLHFNILTTSTSFQTKIWRLFADFAETFRRVSIRQNIPPDSPTSAKPLDWWHNFQDVLSVVEITGSEVEHFGVIFF